MGRRRRGDADFDAVTIRVGHVAFFLPQRVEHRLDTGANRIRERPRTGEPLEHRLELRVGERRLPTRRRGDGRLIARACRRTTGIGLDVATRRSRILLLCCVFRREFAAALLGGAGRRVQCAERYLIRVASRCSEVACGRLATGLRFPPPPLSTKRDAHRNALCILEVAWRPPLLWLAQAWLDSERMMGRASFLAWVVDSSCARAYAPRYAHVVTRAA